MQDDELYNLCKTAFEADDNDHELFFQCIEELLTNNEEQNRKVASYMDQNGWTALFWLVATRPPLELVQRLEQLTPSSVRRSGDPDVGPFEIATAFGASEEVKALLNNEDQPLEADVNMSDVDEVFRSISTQGSVGGGQETSFGINYLFGKKLNVGNASIVIKNGTTSSVAVKAIPYYPLTILNKLGFGLKGGPAGCEVSANAEYAEFSKKKNTGIIQKIAVSVYASKKFSKIPGSLGMTFTIQENKPSDSKKWVEDLFRQWGERYIVEGEPLNLG